MNAPTRPPLSPRQRVVYEFVVEFRAKHGYAPTHREIAHGVGIGSTNGVAEHLQRIVRKGYLRFEPMLARGLVIVDDAPAPSPDVTVRCPNDDGGDQHVRATFHLPEILIEESIARLAGVNTAFGTCTCGARTVLEGRVRS